MTFHPERRQRRGPTLLGVWLIVHGLQALVPAFNFTLIAMFIPVLGLAAGMFILLERQA